MNIVKYKVGLAVGAFVALCHLMWLVLVVTGVAQPLMDWILRIHSLNNPFMVQPIDWINSIILLVVTFIVGFVVGWILALLLGILHKD